MKGSPYEESSRAQKDLPVAASACPRGLRLGALGVPRRRADARTRAQRDSLSHVYARAQCHAPPDIYALSYLHTSVRCYEGPHCDTTPLSNTNRKAHGGNGTLADTRAG